ncbi:hypothetical protein [uncultured Sphingosinicella sp.]|uniref:HEAT repeat domain-containing protein n=1 Tax=uncultured Sphingosinicella sp. TaxID=478748 RepID=UPI0030DB73C7
MSDGKAGSISLEEEDAGAGSGAHSLAGYDYQVDVSVWLALDLMLANKIAQLIELEPASEEDIEADLTETEPCRLATNVTADGYKLVVQAKLRRGDAWTVKGINALLKHGGVRRLSAARRLADTDVRYLLITSAGLNGETRGLRVGRPGSWPKPSGMAKTTVSSLPAKAAGRVGVIASLDEDKLVGEIKRLLIERFGVPYSRWIECLHKLREEARLRIRRVGGGRWQRDEVAHIIREHDGHLAASPQLENYVFPKNWAALREAMASPRYAAVIIGQSGTGKTLATSKLYQELREESPGMIRVPIRHGPQQLRDDTTEPPVLYDIEDPWGRFDFDPASRPWNDQLAGFLAKATHNRRIVVTTRRDVGVSSKALKTVDPWLVPLEVEHYGPQERSKLYRSRIVTLPRDVQLLASGAEKQVLDELASPLEIEKFFDSLRTSGRPDPKNPLGFIRAAMDRAHEASIELTVVEQIRERDDFAAAAVIWGLLKASNKLSIRTVRSLEIDLAERNARFEKGVQPLIDFFVAARNLRVGEGDATYYHPRVEAGVQSALKMAPVPAAVALRALIDVLTDPDGPSPGWGSGIAARILEAVRLVPELEVSAKPAAQRAIDAWIDQQFTDPATRIPEHLRTAAAVGSGASIGAEFGRYINHRPDKTFARLMHWSSPGHGQDWYDRMATAPQMKTIAARFVREMLPNDRTGYGRALVADLERLAPDLTPVYLEATAGIVRNGFDPVVETLAEGALRDLAGFESIVDAAVAELMPTPGNPEADRKERLAYINSVYSDEYMEHMSDKGDGHTAQQLLRAYVDKVREVKGWQSLAQHPHAEALQADWMRSLMGGVRKGTPPSSGEVGGAYSIVRDGENEDAIWQVLRHHWDDSYRDHLTERIRNGSDDRDVRTAALACLIAHHRNMLPQILDSLIAAGDRERAVELAIDLGYILAQRAPITHFPTMEESGPSPEEAEATAAKDLLPVDYAAIAHAARVLRSNDDPVVPLPLPVTALLAATPATRPEVRRLRIKHHATLGAAVRPDIEATLAEARVSWEDTHPCAEAIAAAIALNLTEIIESALDHMFADVVAPALTAIGGPLLAPLPQGLLEFAKAEGSTIRKALVALLLSKPHPDHVPTLMTLAHDQWSSSYRRYEEDDHFPIAHQAIAALGALGDLPMDVLEPLDALGIETTDPNLRYNIFQLLVTHGGRLMQERLLDRAVTPGRASVRRAAAHALVFKMESLDAAVVAAIDAETVTTRMPSVAASLVLAAAHRGGDEFVFEFAQLLAARPKRRVLVLLAIWMTREQRPRLAEALEGLLPTEHPAIAWLRTGPASIAVDDLVKDLGDPATCQEVLRWVNPKEAKA